MSVDIEDRIASAIQLIKDFAVASQNSPEHKIISDRLERLESGFTGTEQREYVYQLWAELHNCDIQTVQDRIDEAHNFEPLKPENISVLLSAGKNILMRKALDVAIANRATELLVSGSAAMTDTQRATLASLATKNTTPPLNMKLN
jgi:hypothetical protein